MLTVGSLCSGYGGIELALSDVLDVDLAWYAEYDDAPAAIMAHHHPGVPNHRDITRIDWTALPPVDIITAGFPCQPFSHAGKRLGANDERHLWPYIAQAIDTLRPRLVMLENVRGLMSAQGEPDPAWVADLDRRASHWKKVTQLVDHKIRKARTRGHLDRIARLEADAVRLSDQRRVAVDTVRRARARLVRAIGVVVRDLANLGYDARWYGLRAADVGAAHGRWRVFIFAFPAHAEGDTWRLLDGNRRAAADAGHPELGVGRPHLTLLPTPAVNDMGEGKTTEWWDQWTADMQERHGNGNGHGRSLAIEAQRLMPTPEAKLATSGPDLARAGREGWGDYASALARAERATSRTAPDPTEAGPKGGRRLSPRFVEWLMMLPEGYVTAVTGLTRNDALKALGNGVVPPQAAAALRAFIADMAEAVAA